jgi:aspartate aminotransferase
MSTILISQDPTWGNHIPIFKNSGFEVKTYKYYDGKGGLDFAGFKNDVAVSPNVTLVF